MDGLRELCERILFCGNGTGSPVDVVADAAWTITGTRKHGLRCSMDYRTYTAVAGREDVSGPPF